MKMKRCSKCNRTYSDETMSFCLADGTLLSAPYYPSKQPASNSATNDSPTAILPAETRAALPDTAETKVATLSNSASSIPLHAAFSTAQKPPRVLTNRNRLKWIIVSVLILFLVCATAVWFLGRTGPTPPVIFRVTNDKPLRLFATEKGADWLPVGGNVIVKRASDGREFVTDEDGKMYSAGPNGSRTYLQHLGANDWYEFRSEKPEIQLKTWKMRSTPGSGQ